MVAGRRDANSPAAPPAARVIMLGASNLTRGIATAVATARHVCGKSLDVMAAMGHGRSYGLESRVLLRTLPGIDGCLLWQDLARREQLPTFALVTDVGNDLAYGASVEQITRWVRCAVDRLLDCDAKVAMTLLPLDNLDRLSPAAFLFFRTMFFPSNRASLDDIRKQAHQLNARLEALGEERGITLIPARTDLYGLDPIHVRRKLYGRYWSDVLGCWGETPPTSEPARTSLATWLYLRRLAPAQQRICGRPQRTEQPAGWLADGTLISWY